MNRTTKTAILLSLAVSLSACAWRDKPTAFEELFTLEVEIADEQCRPGEALIVTVTLTNVSLERQVVRELNADSLTFHCGVLGGAGRRIAYPVVSPKENLDQARPLDPTETLTRPFLFTGVARTTGTFSLTAIYSTPVRGRDESPMAVAPVKTYTVAGGRAFTRGADGLISKTDAVRVARAHFGLGEVEAQVVLIQNEAGLYEWFVALTEVSVAEPRARSCFIRAYLGDVRAEASVLNDVPESTGDANS